jgi:NAD(P)-dependent dehydrogenase (short-subunit alcohol dehydrogenase family)
MLNEKVIVVTGGAGLLGRHFCNAIARQGGIAIVADVNLASAQAVAAEIKASNCQAEAALVDITNAASIESLIGSLHATYGRIDAVVNNAYPRNKNWGKKLENVTYEDFCDCIWAATF